MNNPKPPQVSGLPSDIKSPWLNVIRRLQSVARTENQGYAILTITVLVDQDGCPRLWSEPKCTLVEPKKTDVLAVLAKVHSEQ